MSTTQLLTRPVENQDDPSSPVDSARISFRQPVSTSGFIDAAWWPRSLDLTAELPALLDGLWSAGRDIIRVTYNLKAWDAAPRHLQIEGRTVRLGGFATSDPTTVRLTDGWARERIDVLVLAPDSDPDVAQRALMIAAESGSMLRAAEIMDRARDTTDRPARRP